MSKKTLLMVVGTTCAVSVCWIVVVVVLSWQSVKNLKATNFELAHQESTIAAGLFWPIEKTVGQVSPDVALIGQSLHLLSSSSLLAQQLQTYVPSTLAGDSSAKEEAEQLSTQLPVVENDLTQWSESYKRAKILRPFISRKVHSDLFTQLTEQPESFSHLVHQLVLSSQYLLKNNHRIIVLLQNSDELRATGGFMGSYASVDLSDGVITKLEIQDIYVPDGQFTGYVESPPGASQYLSGGKGLRLPDSNWSPDFPVSAQQVMQFFALGKENQVEGVIAVNLGVAEELMKLTGPIYLPDYSQTVTSENLSTLARSDRSQFFPGSQQKRQFLQALFTQLKLKLGEAAQQHPEAFLRTLMQQAQNKQIQAYSRSGDMQHLIGELNISGKLNAQSSENYYFFVESNVGINKANRLITRQVNLKIAPEQSTAEIHFSNQNPVTSLKEERGEYINYQRVFVPTNFKMSQLTINGTLLENWDEEIITTTSGEQLKQIGFLATVPATEETTVLLTFTHPNIELDTLVLQKQSGLANTPYHIETPTKTYDLLLERDTTLKLD